MSWRDRLREARFREARFFVEDHDATLGRRVQVHEFPMRDRPWAEDLGRRTRELRVEAIVLGDDYMLARDALVRAVETPGPGRLVHPYLGEMRVTVVDCRVSESTREGGMARFSIDLVEAGDDDFTPVSPALSAASIAAADGAAAQLAAGFKLRHAVAGRPDFVAARSASVLGGALQAMQTAMRQVRGAADQVARLNRDIEAAQRDILSIVYEPARAANAVLTNMRQLVRNISVAPREQLALARGFFRFGSLSPVTVDTPSRRAEARNVAELVALVRGAAAAEGARAAAGIDFVSYDEAVSVRDELLAAFDGVMLETPDDAVYDALRAARAAVVRDINARGADLARVVVWAPPSTMTALQVAQRLYADASREQELVARNRVRHPLFVAGARALEVLSDAA